MWEGAQKTDSKHLGCFQNLQAASLNHSGCIKVTIASTHPGNADKKPMEKREKRDEKVLR